MPKEDEDDDEEENDGNNDKEKLFQTSTSSVKTNNNKQPSVPLLRKTFKPQQQQQDDSASKVDLRSSQSQTNMEIIKENMASMEIISNGIPTNLKQYAEMVRKQANQTSNTTNSTTNLLKPVDFVKRESTTSDYYSSATNNGDYGSLEENPELKSKLIDLAENEKKLE